MIIGQAGLAGQQGCQFRPDPGQVVFQRQQTGVGGRHLEEGRPSLPRHVMQEPVESELELVKGIANRA